jgi:aspartate/glutamate racemase
MTPTLVLLHTIPGLVEAFATWCADELPGVRVLHVLDEPMLERLKQRGQDDPEDDEHLLDHVGVAQGIGAAALLVTCSSVSRVVARVRDRAAIPLFAIDDPMAAEAVRIGGRITVVAVEVRLRMVDGALAALLAGDAALHDRLVVAALREAESESDVLVLAQATMARVLEALVNEPLAIPVLASPQLALAEVRKAIHT